MTGNSGGGFRDRFAQMKAAGAAVVPEPEMKALLRERGVAVPRGKVCRNAGEADGFARASRFPLVLKMASDRLLHKTEIGGVRLNISSMEELLEAFDSMRRRFEDTGAEGYTGLLVEEQAPGGVEIIAGLRNDEVFGPVLMVGLGGVYTDLFEDVAFRVLPVEESDILRALQGLRSWPLLAGFRGGDPVRVEALVDTLAALARFGVEMASFYESMDFNPVIATPEGAVVADAKMSLAKAEVPGPFAFERPRTDMLDRFFNPSSVAVMGASAVEGKIGNVILDSLINHEFKGRIYPVNPNHREIYGQPCHGSLSALPEAPDLVVVVVDLKMVPGIVREMARIGSRNALIVSGGGKELGGERAALEAEIAWLAREHGVRIIGPNCIGSFDGRTRFDSFFHSHRRLLRPPAGPMSFITQSGTWGCVFLESAETTGIARMVSYGNRVDVDEGDLIGHLAADEGTRVIGSYIEGLGQGRKFLSAAGNAVAGRKPVVVFKTGRNRQAASAAVSHTGAYGGSYHVYKGAFEQAGIVLTDSFHELYAACESLALQPPARGGRAAMLSNGAGPMVNALDIFPSKGLELVKLSGGSVRLMRDHFSFFYLVENPVDVTGSASAADYEYVIRVLMDDENVDIIMPFFVFQDTPLDESIVGRMEAISKDRRKPLVCCASGGTYTREMGERLTRAGVPVYPDVAQWVAAASALVQWGRILERPPSASGLTGA